MRNGDERRWSWSGASWTRGQRQRQRHVVAPRVHAVRVAFSPALVPWPVPWPVPKRGRASVGASVSIRVVRVRVGARARAGARVVRLGLRLGRYVECGVDEIVARRAAKPEAAHDFAREGRVVRVGPRAVCSARLEAACARGREEMICSVGDALPDEPAAHARLAQQLRLVCVRDERIRLSQHGAPLFRRARARRQKHLQVHPTEPTATASKRGAAVRPSAGCGCSSEFRCGSRRSSRSGVEDLAWSTD